jgi:inosine-uridine nucleoside N-ribohydrolase
VIKGAEQNLIGHINTTADVLKFFGHDGLSDEQNAEPKAKSSDSANFIDKIHAAEALVTLCKEHKGEIVLVAIGPLTNLALALELDPEFARYPKKLVLTGGNIYGEFFCLIW